MAIDLNKMGYGEPLPPPLLAVQATIAAIRGSEIHSYIQESDNAALLEKDEDGEHAPLLLATLDLSHWTSILFVSTLENGIDTALGRLKEAHELLATLLEKDDLDENEAQNNLRATEDALRAANPHEDWSHRPTPTHNPDAVTPMHPLVEHLNIPDGETATIEDYSDGMQSIQADFELISSDADAGRDPAIPFIPPRTVEVRLNSRSQRSWCLRNINLLAPIPTSVWKVWAHLSDAEVKACDDKALGEESSLSKDGQVIPNAFPLVLYDQRKCPTQPVLLYTKQDIATAAPRHP